ncbi:hypothetical protein K504DRAFT_192241 [Pleomassaria siparia CBS 279.74]|uniref:Uncharacterized protein n=1 Tax=Pleomassaria siparia CBS 279.74 TaxID=1314801 RepID=A0A6G1KHP6_9PLEO|nr:hypothetical protein K504DRAFT_192241 [Pleomassaria siparia CBS 279.74]
MDTTYTTHTTYIHTTHTIHHTPHRHTHTYPHPHPHLIHPSRSKLSQPTLAHQLAPTRSANIAGFLKPPARSGTRSSWSGPSPSQRQDASTVHSFATFNHPPRVAKQGFAEKLHLQSSRILFVLLRPLPFGSRSRPRECPPATLSSLRWYELELTTQYIPLQYTLQPYLHLSNPRRSCIPELPVSGPSCRNIRLQQT